MGTLVTIVSFKKGQEAYGFTYWAIQRVPDEKYLQEDGNTWTTDLYGNKTWHFDGYGTALRIAKESGLDLCQHLTEVLSLGSRKIFCTVCGVLVAWIGERTINDQPNVARIYIKGKPIKVSTKTGKPV